MTRLLAVSSNISKSNTLRDIEITFVSLVPKGADQDAHIRLYKQADDGPTAAQREAPSTPVARTEPPTMSEITKAASATLDALAAKEMERDPSLMPSTARARAASTPEGRAAYDRLTTGLVEEGVAMAAPPMAKAIEDFDSTVVAIRKANPTFDAVRVRAEAHRSDAGKNLYEAMQQEG